MAPPTAIFNLSITQNTLVYALHVPPTKNIIMTTVIVDILVRALAPQKMYCDHDALVHLQRSIRLPLFTRSSYLFFQQVLNNCRLNSVDCCDFYFFLTFDLHQMRMHD
jgi:hypothetical protein